MNIFENIGDILSDPLESGAELNNQIEEQIFKQI